MALTRPFWSRSISINTTPAAVHLPDGWAALRLFTDVNTYAAMGDAYTPPSVSSVNGVTTLTLVGGATGGTFTLRVFPDSPDSVLTGAIAYNATATDIRDALVSTGRFASSDITAGGGPLQSAAVTLTWQGVYAATVPAIALGTVALTGGMNPSVNVSTTTLPRGNGNYGLCQANANEVWERDPSMRRVGRYLYLAAASGTGTCVVTLYR